MLMKTEVSVRSLNFEEILNFIPMWYELVNNEVLYLDIDFDKKSDWLLILEHQDAVDRNDESLPMKFMVVQYNKKTDKWLFTDEVSFSGWMKYWDYFFFSKELNKIFLKTRSYGVVDGVVNLISIKFDKRLILEEVISTSITNGWDIILENNGVDLVKIDKIFNYEEWEAREWCHKFIVDVYSYVDWSYEKIQSWTTNFKYSYNFNINNELYFMDDGFKGDENCILVGWWSLNRKVNLILKEVWIWINQ